MNGPQHLDRLRAFDASFLLMEGSTPHAYAHVGGVVIVEGPPPHIEAMRAQIASRLDLIPRYRQRIAHTLLDRARPVWVDDTHFDISYHVRSTGLPSPGDREQFRTAVGQAYSQPLDHSRPLWEIWVVEGLENDSFAMIFKVHHSVVDGSAAVDLLTMLCDVSPDPAPSATSISPWQPQPTPSSLELIAHGVREAARTAVQVAAGAVEATRDPQRAISAVRDLAEGMDAVVRQLLRPPPKTPLTGEIGSHRLFADVSVGLDDAKLVKNTFGGTVNDVALAVVTSALREFLLSRDVDTEGIELTALVPVSLRTEDERGHMGNRIAVLRGRLPVYVEDPLERLRVVTESMTALKSSTQAFTSETVLSLQNYLPPMLLPYTNRLNITPRLFNLMVTNIPGPQMPLYVLGRRLLEIFPIAMLHPDRPLAIAISSYDGQLTFGLLGDYDAMPDLEIVSGGIAAGLAELVAMCGLSVVPPPPPVDAERAVKGVSDSTLVIDA